MAVWQYSFNLRQTEVVNKENFIQEVSKIFGEIVDENNLKIIFGNYTESSFSIFLNDDKSFKSFYCRIDLRNVKKEFLDKVRNFILDNYLEIYDDQGNQILVGDFFRNIRNSEAFNFSKFTDNFFFNFEKNDLK